MPAALRGPLAIDPSMALAAFEWMPDPAPAEDARLHNGVLSIRVDGPLSADAWWGTNYGDIQRPLREAAAGGYASIKSIVLDIDSPGGTVTGIAETVAAIEAARKAAPVIAFVRGNCASAAFWIASACDRIVALHTAKAGCVGAVVTVMDVGGLAKKMGVEIYRFTSGRTPGKNPAPGSEEFNAETQRLIDAAGDAFLGDLARLRGTPGDLDAVADFYGRGAYMPAADALKAGWIDAVIPADASGPHAWLLTGDAPPDGEGDNSAPRLPLFNRAHAHHHEEASMAKSPEGAAGAPPLNASEAAESAFIAQIKTLTEANAAAVERAEIAERKLASDAAERAGLAGRVASMEAQIKAQAEATERREIAALINNAIARGAIAPGDRAKREAFAGKFGRDALAEALDGIPSEAAGPRVSVTSGKGAPGGPVDEVAKRRRVADRARALMASGEHRDYWQAVSAAETEQGVG